MAWTFFTSYSPAQGMPSAVSRVMPGMRDVTTSWPPSPATPSW